MSVGQGTGWDCYISLLCSYIILPLLQALRALAKPSIIFRTHKFRYNNACLKLCETKLH